MKGNSKLRLALSFFAAASLYPLYFVFLSVLLPRLSLADPLQAAIVYTQLARLIVLVSIRKLREGPPQLKIIFFSLEIFFIAFLILAFFVTGDPFYDSLLGEILVAWLGATFLIITPYSIFRLGWGMYRGGSLYSNLSNASFEFVTVLFLADLLSSVSGSPPTTVGALGALIINSLTGELRTGSEIFTYNGLVEASSVVFFVSLVLYATLVNNPRTDLANANRRSNYSSLIFPFVATLILVVWMSLAILFTSDIFLVLSSPAVMIAVCIWFLTRSKKTNDTRLGGEKIPA